MRQTDDWATGHSLRAWGDGVVLFHWRLPCGAQGFSLGPRRGNQYPGGHVLVWG